MTQADLNDFIEAALVDKYAELIVSAHQSDCLWKRRGCDGEVLMTA